jgi:hypothetical protein
MMLPATSFAGIIGVDPGHDLHQRRFAGAVGPEYADLGPGQEREGDVLHHLLATGVGLAQVLHHIDVLIRGQVFDPTNELIIDRAIDGARAPRFLS